MGQAMGWEFVGCPGRLGQVKKVGPVTGTTYVITPQGVWIWDEDAWELYEIIEPIWCFRANRFIDMHTVFKLNPSADQYRQKPS